MSDNSLDTTTEDRSVDDQTPTNGDAPDEAQDVTQGPDETLSTGAEQEAESSPEPQSAEGSSDEQPATAAASQPEPVEAQVAETVETEEVTVEDADEAVEVPAAVSPSAVEVSTDGEVSVEEADEDEDEEIDDFFAPGDWFVVHTYAGYENKVKANLASRIQSMNMEDKIYDVVVPTEEVMELKSGKMQNVQKKVFPGYILVRMQLDDDSWYVVRNTPGVTGFVGSGAKPTPLDHSEVTKILAPKTEDRPKPKLEYEVGEVVSVIGGAFAGYSGPVETIDQEKQQVRVLLDLFGRETPVELMFDQVTKL